MHYKVEAKVIGIYYVHVEASSERFAQRKAMNEIDKGKIKPIKIKEIECLDVEELRGHTGSYHAYRNYEAERRLQNGEGF